MAFQSFEDLEVWQRGCGFAVDLFETFSSCDSNKEFVRFLNISKGSCGELRTQLYISRKLGFIKKADSDRLVTESKEISAMLHGLARAVRKPFSKKQRVSVFEN
jgi:hypothetical protein